MNYLSASPSIFFVVNMLMLVYSFSNIGEKKKEEKPMGKLRSIDPRVRYLYPYK